MKLIKPLITISTFLFIPISFLIFLYSTSVKPVVTYEFSPQGQCISKDIMDIPQKLKEVRQATLDIWNPPITSKKEQFVFKKSGHQNIAKFNKLERSAFDAFLNAQDKVYGYSDLKYEIIFNYNPALKNKKEVYISKIFISKSNSKIIDISILFSFLSFLPSIIFYFLNKKELTSIQNEIQTYLESLNENTLIFIDKSWGLNICFAGIWMLTISILMNKTCYELILLEKNISSFDIKNHIVLLICLLILAIILYLILDWYYSEFLIVTQKRILKFKDGQMVEQIKFKDIYKIEDDPKGSEFGGKLTIISNRNTDTLTFNMSGDPLEAKKIIKETIIQFKKDNNITEDPAIKKEKEIEKLIKEELIQIQNKQLTDVRYCQFCGAEFNANQNRCPICDKIND